MSSPIYSDTEESNTTPSTASTTSTIKTTLNWRTAKYVNVALPELGKIPILIAAQRLREAQCKFNLNEGNPYIIKNPLDVLTEVKTRWNATYLAWKRVLELHNAMRFVSTSLLAKSDRASKIEGEKLDRLCLSVDEKEFLQDMVKLLEPIERVTRRLCGAKYPTINLVYPYMKLLKKEFAPKMGETVDTYLNLIYGENTDSVSEENESDETSDDDIPAAGTRKHWQYAHRQFRQKMVARGREQKKKIRVQPNNTEFEDIDRVEYLPPVATTGLLRRVRAAIYLSMDKLWDSPSDIALVATFLDPRFKHFNWATSIERNKAQNLVEVLYEELKIKLAVPDDIEERDHNDDDDNNSDFFHELEANFSRTDTEE
ncbi:17789_t:CDS:2, partial [Gigaspora rosea]